MLDKTSSIPAYIQIRNSIAQKIREKELHPGEPVPSERELAATLRISRMTVRQAFRLLESEGYLYREKGRGTFVSKPVFEQRDIMSFTELVKGKGYSPATRILGFDLLSLPEDISPVFGSSGTGPFYHVKRLRLADGEPLAYEEVYLPERTCPGLVPEDFEQSLHNMLSQKFNRRISHVDSSLRAIMPQKEMRKILDITGQIPLLSVTSVNYDQNGEPVYYESSYYRSDEFRYAIRLNLY